MLKMNVKNIFDKIRAFFIMMKSWYGKVLNITGTKWGESTNYS